MMKFADPFPAFRLGTRLAFFIILFSANFSSAQSGDFTRVQPLRANGIENFFKLSDKVYSGGTPAGENAFAELKKLGIKTIITVDGGKPDVETAAKFGLRYVHLPVGYDGVPIDQALKLVKAARELPKPIYVHCHHGMHRGPAGAAIICKGMENWTPQQAWDWLKQAGTATNYSGLYKSVEDFNSPSAEELKKIPDNFPEQIETSPLVVAMVEIDHRFDNLKLIRKANQEPASVRLGLNPAHEALLLEEAFKELNRWLEAQNHGKDFQNKMTDAQTAANELRMAFSKLKNLSDADKTELSAAFDKVTKSCASCHKAHRN
jgi:protein tyrosine phosphatase (PTP) superfamily phosphohydrolase (DUF442 family)